MSLTMSRAPSVRHQLLVMGRACHLRALYAMCTLLGLRSEATENRRKKRKKETEQSNTIPCNSRVKKKKMTSKCLLKQAGLAVSRYSLVQRQTTRVSESGGHIKLSCLFSCFFPFSVLPNP